MLGQSHDQFVTRAGRAYLGTKGSSQASGPHLDYECDEHKQPAEWTLPNAFHKIDYSKSAMEDTQVDSDHTMIYYNKIKNSLRGQEFLLSWERSRKSRFEFEGRLTGF